MYQERPIVLYRGERRITDGQSDDVLDGLTLELVIESKDKLTSYVIDNAAITRSGTEWECDVPTALTSTPRELLYALREVSSQEVKSSGVLTVRYAPRFNRPVIGSSVIGSTFIVG